MFLLSSLPLFVVTAIILIILLHCVVCACPCQRHDIFDYWQWQAQRFIILVSSSYFNGWCFAVLLFALTCVIPELSPKREDCDSIHLGVSARGHHTLCRLTEFWREHIFLLTLFFLGNPDQAVALKKLNSTRSKHQLLKAGDAWPLQYD